MRWVYGRTDKHTPRSYQTINRQGIVEEERKTGAGVVEMMWARSVCSRLDVCLVLT